MGNDRICYFQRHFASLIIKEKAEKRRTLQKDYQRYNTPISKSCDVAAVHLAKKHRELSAQTGTEGLTDLQREIYNFIKLKGKLTKQELMDYFKLPDWELEKQITILRHCELVKGRKEADKVFFVLLDA